MWLSRAHVIEFLEAFEWSRHSKHKDIYTKGDRFYMLPPSAYLSVFVVLDDLVERDRECARSLAASVVSQVRAEVDAVMEQYRVPYEAG